MIDPTLPLIDLHRHLDGSVRLETILDLGRQHNLPLPAWDLESLRPYVQELQAVSPGAQLIVAANKRDLVAQPPAGSPPALDSEQVQAVAASLGVPYYFTSAKTGDQVEALFRHLGQQLVG